MTNPPPAPAPSIGKQWLQILGYVVAIAAVVAVVWWFLAGARANGGGGSQYSPSEYRVLAERSCEGAVGQNLKAPSTAKFDSSADGSGPWVVTGSVDAENSFGAMIRTDYRCTVTLDGDRMVATLEVAG